MLAIVYIGQPRFKEYSIENHQEFFYLLTKNFIEFNVYDFTVIEGHGKRGIDQIKAFYNIVNI